MFSPMRRIVSHVLTNEQNRVRRIERQLRNRRSSVAVDGPDHWYPQQWLSQAQTLGGAVLSTSWDWGQPS